MTKAKKKTMAKKADKKSTFPAIGSDEEIRASCAERIEGWGDMADKLQNEIIALTREFWQLKFRTSIEVTKNDDGTKISAANGGCENVQTMRYAVAFASMSHELLSERISDLVNFHQKTNSKGVSSQNLSASIAFIEGGNATDPVQSALLMQMDATHDSAMRALATANGSDCPNQSVFLIACREGPAHLN